MIYFALYNEMKKKK